VLADAPGIVAQIPDGTRITFGPQRSDLNPATDAAISDLAHKLPDGIFNLLAYAAGNSDDPSTPRRLSLSRALNARSVLIAAGIPSTHIYVRALGPNNTPPQPDIPPDRVDITVTATQSPAKSTPDAQPVSTTPK
jgi:outer membrane protein OmpA-like peptidoglycan-associated protein